MVSGGAAGKVGFSGSVVELVLSFADDLSSPPLLRTRTITRMTAIGIRKKARFLADRQNRRRFSSASSYSRRATRFCRCRSRLAALDTAAESIQARIRREITRKPLVPSWSVALVVQKFGGTSVADPARVKAVAEHIVA